MALGAAEQPLEALRQGAWDKGEEITMTTTMTTTGRLAGCLPLVAWIRQGWGLSGEELVA